MLNQFKLANLQKVDYKDRAILYGLIDGIIEWHELAKATQAKYRKMIKQSDGFETELADKMKQVLVYNLDELQAELNGYLTNFDIQK